MKKAWKQRLKQANVALEVWADWTVRHMEISCIGYPSKTVEARLQELRHDGGARSRVPNLMMPPHIAAIDRSVREMPSPLKCVVMAKYMTTGQEMDKVKRWCRDHGQKPGAYYALLDCVHTWVVRDLRRT